MFGMRHGYGRLRSARFRVRAAVAVALAASVLVGAGCGSESHADETKPVDLSKLDTGTYPTKPHQYAPKDAALAARNAEALRLGSAMPLPMEIDPALTHTMLGVHPFTGADSLEGTAFLDMLNIKDFAANTPGLVAGFATAAQSEDDWNISRSMRQAVMIFESPDAANSAALALAHSGFFPGTSRVPPVPVPSTAYPSAQVIWLPDDQILASFYATGQFVIISTAVNEENWQLKVSDLPGLQTLADKATAAAVDRLATFQPTAKDKLSDLPLDPQSMLRLTIPLPASPIFAYAFDGTLDKRTDLGLASDAAKTRASFDKAGVDYVSYGTTQLIRTRDAAAAKDLYEGRTRTKFEQLIDSPPGLSTAQCFKGTRSGSPSFHCYLTYGRYLAQAMSTQQQDAYQQISAQYAILANDK
ncbi:hypothetical protein ACFXHA_06750 [Nocardia sp. NPDC059240]|uniref:DUF7373 family lipoprotein n=1 Tax=Nocardia sp. NPDC059240 TaxID=3346786 RepID=UPI0036AECAB1